MGATDWRRWGVRAERAFRDARRAADREARLCRLRGRSPTLLDLDPVLRRFGLRNKQERGLHEVPLDWIVGSAGKASQFTPRLLPRFDWMREPWKEIYKLVQGLEGAPPVELYKVGDGYFIRDGHHRCSVARALGVTEMEAYVTEYPCDDAITFGPFEGSWRAPPTLAAPHEIVW